MGWNGSFIRVNLRNVFDKGFEDLQKLRTVNTSRIEMRLGGSDQHREKASKDFGDALDRMLPTGEITVKDLFVIQNYLKFYSPTLFQQVQWDEINYFKMGRGWTYYGLLYKAIPRFIARHSQTAANLWETLTGIRFGLKQTERVAVTIPAHRSERWEKDGEFRIREVPEARYIIHRGWDVSFLTPEEAATFSASLYPVLDRVSEFEKFIEEELEMNWDDYVSDETTEMKENDMKMYLTSYKWIVNHKRFLDVIYAMAHDVGDRKGAELLVHHNSQ